MQTRNKNNLKTIVRFNNIDYALAILSCAVPTIIFLMLGGGFLWYHCIIPMFSMLICYLLNKNRLCFDTSVLLLIPCLISIMIATVDKQNAIHEAEKILCLILPLVGCKVFIDGRRFFELGLLAGNVICAIIGILAYCNILKLPELVFVDGGIIRLQSIIKYANTTAVILGTGYILNMHNEKRAVRYLSVTILISMYLTVSKAALPIFVIIVTGSIIFNREQYQHIILENLICIVFALPIIYFAAHRMFPATLIAIIICIISGGGIRIRYSKFLLYIWLFLLIICAIIGCCYVLKKFGIQHNTFSKRLVYMCDSLTLLKQNWLFGIGPGGWETMQYKVQSSAYSVKYIHNGPLQLLIENGILFFAVFVERISRAMYFGIKKRDYAISGAILFIGLHSLIDMDFAFSSVYFILGACCALTSDIRQYNISNKVFRTVFVGVCSYILLYMTIEYSARTIFYKNYNSYQYDNALNNALFLEKICPNDSDNQLFLAKLDIDNQELRLYKASELAPMDRLVLKNRIIYAANNGKEDLRGLCEQYIDIAPLQEGTYADITQIVKQAYERHMLMEEKYLDIVEYTHGRRIENNVEDRNLLLQTITDENK